MPLRRLLFPAIAIAALAVSLPLMADQKVRCESKGGKRVCPADDISSVILLEQRSISACEEGESWGYTRDAIWVDHGCRADFQVLTRRDERERHRDRDRDRDDDGDRDNDRGRDRDRDRDSNRLLCESSGGRRFCAADTSFGVSIARTFGDRECVKGRSWGYGDRGVWVDRGCRAEFLLGRESEHRRPARTEVVRCESKDNHRGFCRVDGLARVELKKQLSLSECKYDESWGYNREGIWVTDGCRADFLVHSR